MEHTVRGHSPPGRMPLLRSLRIRLRRIIRSH